MSLTDPTEEQWIHLEINPEPWAIGPLSTGRKGTKVYPKIGRNAQLFAYQEAVRAELKDAVMIDPPYDLYFFFWRNSAEYRDAAGRRRKRNNPDSTNMQKALEDALQGVLIGNDRDVLRIGSEIVDAGPEVAGQIVIRLRKYMPLLTSRLPSHIMHFVTVTQNRSGLGLNEVDDDITEDWTDEDPWG